MTVDNVTLFWAFFLMSLGFMGAIIAFLYWASKRQKK